MPIRKFFAKRITTSPIPPEPEPSTEAIGGWGAVYNSGIGVTGGTGGTLRTYTNATTMLNDLIASSASTPEIYYFTGVSQSIGTGIKIITGKSNKTILCSSGQELRDGEIRFLSCENIIIRNITRAGLTLVHEDYGGVTRDGFTIDTCLGVWIDHVEVNGNNVWGGVSGSTNIFWDGCIDINLSNYITISNSLFTGADRGILIGYGDTQIGNRGLLNVTIRNCKFTNIRQRAPRARFGKIHLLNNLFEWSPVWGTSGLNRPGTVRFVQTGNECEIYGQNNWFDNGQNLSTDPDTGDPKLSGLLLDGSYVGSFSSSSITSLRPSNVVWRPNTTTFYTYAIPLQTPTQAKEYVNIWAGAKFHLKQPIV
jgi:pectate lyase